jgi:hypothetical protein
MGRRMGRRKGRTNKNYKINVEMSIKKRKPGTGLHGNQGRSLTTQAKVPISFTIDAEDIKFIDGLPGKRAANLRDAVKAYREKMQQS